MNWNNDGYFEDEVIIHSSDLNEIFTTSTPDEKIDVISDVNPLCGNFKDEDLIICTKN